MCCFIIWIAGNYWCRCNVLELILCNCFLGVECGQQKERERAIDMLQTTYSISSSAQVVRDWYERA